MLHAWRLECMHPAGKGTMRFEAPLPEDMANLINKLREMDV